MNKATSDLIFLIKDLIFRWNEKGGQFDYFKLPLEELMMEIHDGSFFQRSLGDQKGGRATEDRPHLPVLKMRRCRVRYFTVGAVIGSKAFVNEAFAGARSVRDCVWGLGGDGGSGHLGSFA